MVDVVEGARGEAPAEAKPRRPLPRWVITIGSLVVLLGAWEILGRDVNPVFGSYPSAIAEAFWQLARTGKLWTALLDSLRPFLLGYGLAIVVGIPIGLVIGRFRAVEAAIGQYRHFATDHPAGNAALHHGRDQARRGPRRGRDGDRRVLHLHLRAGRDHHHVRQQFRHRDHVRAHRRADG